MRANDYQRSIVNMSIQRSGWLSLGMATLVTILGITVVQAQERNTTTPMTTSQQQHSDTSRRQNYNTAKQNLIQEQRRSNTPQPNVSQGEQRQRLIQANQEARKAQINNANARKPSVSH